VIDYIAYSKMLTLQVDMCFPFEYGFYRKIGLENLNQITEIGCGNGYFLKTLSEYYTKPKYLGFDHSVELIKMAQTGSEKINFRVGSVEFLDNTADLLILRLIMHQLENRKNFIAKLSEILPSTSQVVIIDAFDEHFQLTPELPAFNEHLKKHREALSPNTASRSIKHFIEQEMNEFSFYLDKSNYYYVPSLLPDYKEKYYKYMLSTSMILGCHQNVLDEINTWREDPYAYAQIGIFMYCFKKLKK